MTSTEMTYRDAMAELNSIVECLRESENVDVDELVANVARAKELITFCGAKVKKADSAIKAIVSELQVNENTAPVLVSQNGDTSDDDAPF